MAGGGNSGAQVLAEVSKVADAAWVSLAPPVFLPDDVDGRVLFERAIARWKAQQEGCGPDATAGGLGDLVRRSARRARGVLRSVRPFVSFEPDGVVGRTAAGRGHLVHGLQTRTGALRTPRGGRAGRGDRGHGHRPLRPGATALPRRLRQLNRHGLGNARRGDAGGPGRRAGDSESSGGRRACGCALSGEQYA
jgi:hypothetical protein